MRLPAMAPRGALEREAKHLARIGHRSLSPGLDARSLTVFELAGLRPPHERIGISPHPLVPYPWDSSFSLGWCAQAEEAELIGKEQEVWVGEIVAVIGKEKTYSGQAEAVVGELEHWIMAFPVHPSSADPQ